LIGVIGVVGLAFLFGAAPDAAADDPRPEIGTWGVDLEARDTSADPGNDFFRHANGAWLDTYEIPEDLPFYGSFVKLYLRSEEQVREIIEETAGSDAEEGTPARKVADLYNGYLDVDALNAKGLESLEPYFQEVRAAGSHDDIAHLLARFDRIDGGGPFSGSGNTTPFSFYIDQDEKDPTQYIPHFMQSGLGLPDRDYYLGDDNPRFVEARKVYAEYLEKLFIIAGKSEPSMRAERILALETRFAEAHWPSEDMRDIDKTYNKMSRKELQELAPDFPWTRYLGTVGFENQDEFIIMPPSAYAGMAKAFLETPVEVWQDYLDYRLLRNNAEFLPKEVDEVHFEFVSKALWGSEEQRDRWKRGVQFVNGSMGFAVGEIYVERHFTQTAKERIDELVANLIVAMGERLDGLDWMSEETKKQARDKLSKFAVKIGYPEEWRDYSKLEIKEGDLLGNAMRARAFAHDYEVAKLGKPVDRTEWFMSPQTINAYYNSGMNEIVFPAGILQPPFFDPYADDAVNYGGIGVVIGHEIGHGFDDQGRKSDGDGVLRDWWTEGDVERFKKKTDVLVEQYNKFSPLEGMTVNGELTLGENIGDLGGLEIAYHAYKLSLNGGEAPVIEGLTGDQRFFLGFAQIWRSKMRDEIMTQILAADPHSPPEFRVDGSLPNMDAWYEAFDVKPGDAMYLPPEERVRIW
jgi:predicted metalloendopeptidase